MSLERARALRAYLSRKQGVGHQSDADHNGPLSAITRTRDVECTTESRLVHPSLNSQRGTYTTLVHPRLNMNAKTAMIATPAEPAYSTLWNRPRA